MALVNCSECGKEMSSEAAACPSCGKPTKKKSQQTQVSGIVIVIILLVVAAAIVGALKPEAGQYAGLAAAALAWIAGAWKFNGGALKRVGGGFVVGFGVLILSALSMTFCGGVFTGAQ
jgi:RNA polymerase subunit RPABC4/transcription elongation factor Spt4